MTQFPIDVTVDRLVEFHGLADALCVAELGRYPTHTVGDPVAEIIEMMALRGQTGEQIQAWLHEQPEAIAHRTKPPLPPIPTREQVCGVHLTFQGLTVETQQYGPIAWFEPWLVALSESDRQAVYAAKHAAGDRHCIVEFLPGGTIYNEPPFDRYVSPNYEADPPAFRAIVEEIIRADFTPIVVFNGDNADNPTDGYPNALRQLPILVDLFTGSIDLTPYILFGRLWDGVFYGSSPENIANFGKQFRALLPNGYLAIEHNPGHIPCGEGGSDWNANGAMTTYDVLFSEYENGVPHSGRQTGVDAGGQPTYEGDTIWQVAGRTIRPFHRDPNQTGDINPPWYLAPGNPRGPYFVCAFEFDAYRWVREQVSASDVEAERAYLRSLGYQYLG